MKFIKSICFLLFTTCFLLGCDQETFGEDLEVQVLPTNLSYSEILGIREFSYIETGVPTYNSNGYPVMFEVVSIKKENVILDDSYLNSISIINPETIEIIIDNNNTGEEVFPLNDTSKAGKIIISDGNPFSNGDYYFTIKATVNINDTTQSVVFDDVLHLQVGPELVESISFCPFRSNFVVGENSETVAPEVFGGNPDIIFELGSDSEKLSIDSLTGAISLNSGYSISETEYLNPIINVVSSISGEITSFENTITIVLSITPEEFDQDIDYFLFPELKPEFPNNTAAAGEGYSVEISAFKTKPNWVRKVIYQGIPNSQKLIVEEAVSTRAKANVDAIGLNLNFWGDLKNPWETWAIMDAVNLNPYKSCYESKLIFWVRQNFNTAISEYFEGEETPLHFEVQITDNYNGDVYEANWTKINDILMCKIEGVGEGFIGTPYPLSGTLEPATNALGSWVRCELDLSDYSDISSFTVAFRSKTSYDTDIPINLRGALYISDVHFIASEKI